MKFFNGLAFIISLLISNLTSACYCIKLGDNFFDTVNQHNLKVNSGEYPATNALTIFTGKVVEYQEAPPGALSPAMLVTVKQVLQGTISDNYLWIYGNVDGMQCRPAIQEFTVGAHYVFAVNQDEDKEFFISACGYYYLKTK